MIKAQEANKIVNTVKENINLNMRIANYLRELESEIIRLSKNGLCEVNLSIIATEKLHTTFDGPLKNAILKELREFGYFTDGLRACWGVGIGGFLGEPLSEEDQEEVTRMWNEKKFPKEPKEIKHNDGTSVIVYNKDAASAISINGVEPIFKNITLVPDPEIDSIAKEEEKGEPLCQPCFKEGEKS